MVALHIVFTGHQLQYSTIPIAVKIIGNNNLCFCLNLNADAIQK